VADHAAEGKHPIVTAEAADWAARQLRIVMAPVTGGEVRVSRHDPAREDDPEPRLEHR
jgi:hypothetical protein